MQFLISLICYHYMSELAREFPHKTDTLKYALLSCVTQQAHTMENCNAVEIDDEEWKACWEGLPYVSRHRSCS
mgnify:CR=1 FL=1